MKKKILIWFICAILALGITTGCNLNKDTDNGSKNNKSAKKESKGKCDVFECINKINTDSTLDKVNKIIGFEGEYIGKNYEVYYWQLTEDT